MLYEYLNEQLGSNDADGVAGTQNRAGLPLPPARPSQHTLSPADLAPPWRGPPPRKDGRGERPA
jgi:hypothetical protein